MRRFSALPYAHRPGIAAYLNDWARGFAADGARVPVVGDVLPRARGARRTSTSWSPTGVEVFKVHVQVGEFHLDDPLLDAVWGTLADAGTPVVVHAGSGPVGNDVHRARTRCAGCSSGSRG